MLCNDGTSSWYFTFGTIKLLNSFDFPWGLCINIFLFLSVRFCSLIVSIIHYTFPWPSARCNHDMNVDMEMIKKLA